MRPILVMDFLENRLTLLIILAVAVVSLMGAAFFKVLDNDVARLLLFVLQGPLFILLISNHIISSEVNNRTFRFLASLPISRTGLWGAKLVFLLIFTLIIYVFYAILLLLVGTSVSEIAQLIASNPAKSLLFPVLVLSFGYYSSMLPQGVGFIAGLILLPFAAALYLNDVIAHTVNYSLGAALLIIMFLALSWVCFKIDRKMNSPWRGPKGLGLLVLGILGFFFCWGTLNQMIERSQMHLIKASQLKFGEANYVDHISGYGSKVFFTQTYNSPWWNVIHNQFSSERKYLRLFMHDVDTNKTSQIGPRSTMLIDYQDLGSKYLLVQKPIVNAGIMRKINRVVIDSNGNEVLTLPENVIDADRRNQLFSIDDDRFAFAATTTVDKNSFIEFYLYETGKGLKIVRSVEKTGFDFDGFFKIPNINPEKAAHIVAAGSVQDSKQYTLISLADGQITRLPEPYGLCIATIPGAMVFDRAKTPFSPNSKERELVMLDLEGNLTQLDFIPVGTKFIATTHSGKVLVMTPADEQPDYWRVGDQPHNFASIAIADFHNNQLNEIVALEPDDLNLFLMHESGQKAVLTTSNYDEETEITTTTSKMFDSETLSFTPMPHLNDVLFVPPLWSSINIEFLPDNRFAFTLSGFDVHILDLNSMTLEKKADLRKLIKGEASHD